MTNIGEFAAKRLDAASELFVKKGENDGTYLVPSSGRDMSGDVHVVKLDLANRQCECNCPDHKYRGTACCKHVIAALRYCGDAEVVAKIGPMPAPVASPEVEVDYEES